jgi:hypothetical protein
MSVAYSVFGASPLLYNLSAFLFRLLSAFGIVHLFSILWPRYRDSGLAVGVLYLIYPGFLSQFNGIDYQSQMVSLAAAVFSIVLTLEAIRNKKVFLKILLFLFSGLLACLYIGLVEYFIGFEFIRLAGIFLLVKREIKSPWKQILQTIRMWLPMLLFLIPFIVWRLYFFESARAATDVSLQLGSIVQSPLTTSLRWLMTLFLDSIEVIVLAWGQPLSSLISWVWSRNLLLLGLGVGIISALIVLFALKQVEGTQESDGGKWEGEAFGFGLLSVVAGLLPIVLVNRYVDFTFYSRYTLVSSVGAAVLLVALASLLKKNGLQKVLIGVLIFTASLTHYANSQRAIQITQVMRDFWWQMSWRAPQLERGTTLVANYSVGATEEDYFVWGPANLIYFPESTRDEFVQPGVYAALLNQNTVNKTLLNEGQEFDNRRTIRTYKNYRKLLVVTQPTKNSCVHVIDGQQPEYSSYENAYVRLLGSYSKPEQILTNEPDSRPPSLVFGPEPEHTWCYFYQKASLARQRQDWNAVQRLGSEVIRMKLLPGDPIEWMPFLQAYALNEDVEQLKDLAPNVVADPYIAQQTCHILVGLSNLPQPTLDVISENYCID